jgi:hypothetical protein
MKAMGLDEDAMREIEAAIAAAPDAHPMIKGLRGARKARFPLPGSRQEWGRAHDLLRRGRAGRPVHDGGLPQE